MAEEDGIDAEEGQGHEGAMNLHEWRMGRDVTGAPAGRGYALALWGGHIVAFWVCVFVLGWWALALAPGLAYFGSQFDGD